MKHKIEIISSSIRIGRKSHSVALFFQKQLQASGKAEASIIDLEEYDFPLFHERLQYLESPLPKLQEYADRIKNADGIIIVTPENNGGYPASLKNAVDVLYHEWYHQPVGIVTVSDGPFGGNQVITSLQFTLWKMKAWTISAMYPVAKVQDNYEEDGNPTAQNAEAPKRAAAYLKEFFWCVEAKKKMNNP